MYDPVAFQSTKAQETEDESSELADSKPTISLTPPEKIHQGTFGGDKCWAAALESWLVASGRTRIKKDDLCIKFSAYTLGDGTCYLQIDKIFKIASLSTVKMYLEEIAVPDSEDDFDSWISENLPKGHIYAALMDKGQDIGHCVVIYQIGYVNKRRAVTYMEPINGTYQTTYVSDFVKEIKTLKLGYPL